MKSNYAAVQAELKSFFHQVVKCVTTHRAHYCYLLWINQFCVAVILLSLCRYPEGKEVSPSLTISVTPSTDPFAGWEISFCAECALLEFNTCSFHKISEARLCGAIWDAVQINIYCKSRVGRGAVEGAKGLHYGVGVLRRGRDGPEAPSEMLAQHGSCLPGHGFRRVKSEKTNLPVDLSGEIWIVWILMAGCNDDEGV